MVEYAILLILLVTLFVGGTELGLTALASNKNTEAAKSGISEYAAINQQRLNILNNEKQYLLNLAGYDCIKIYSNAHVRAGECALSTESNDVLQDYIKYMDTTFLDAEMNASGSGINELLSLRDQYQAMLEASFVGPSANCLTAVATVNWDTNADCQLSVDEIMSGQVTSNEDGQLKYQYLLLDSHSKLATLPLDFDLAVNANVPLSQVPLLIGDSANASAANCNGGNYDDGFPDNPGQTRFISVKYTDAANIEQTYQAGEMLYLFQPLAVDVTSCDGVDAERDNKPRLRILIDGYTPSKEKLIATGKSFEALFVPGLPKLNQAMYSNYENVCLDTNNAYVSCTSANVAQRLLKPPGKLCIITTDTPGVDRCIANVNPAGVTGFYFFANANDAPAHSFEYTQIDVDRGGDGNPDFSPAMQVECRATPDKNIESIVDSACLDNTSKVRIHTRYRRVFEGFLTFGLMSLTSNDLLPYFFNPSLVGEDNHVVIGIHGSEVGPLARNGNPSIKHFMDFRGCYEVDVATNQVSTCN